ncbi:unnamed protein product [Brassica napus]|uniref:L-ascorbate oxidase n=1 Tax=Brassica napus TaxID=3708 RepID=A0A817B8V0_BRANA|nr:unnamed protein product [Brassica napus]
MSVVVWWLVTVVMVTVHSASAGVVELNWEVEYKLRWPDCKEGIVIAINGEFPGPTIDATAGDTVIIHVTNKLSTEGVVIHWHGIRQNGTPWADGAAGVTQCPINPGETFTYNFIVDKAGTHFYHGHYGMQRSAGLYGMMIVRSPKETLQYDGEFNLLLSDWWHQGSHAQELYLSSRPMRWIGEPQSLLINGRGQFNCSLAAYFNEGGLKECKFKDNDDCAPTILRVEPLKVYRLRIASTTALASLNLAVELLWLVLVLGFEVTASLSSGGGEALRLQIVCVYFALQLQAFVSARFVLKPSLALSCETYRKIHEASRIDSHKLIPMWFRDRREKEQQRLCKIQRDDDAVTSQAPQEPTTPNAGDALRKTPSYHQSVHCRINIESHMNRPTHAGTHFYHGHYGMQRSAGLYGMMVVRSPKETLHYDEFNLLLSDWWHLSSTLQELSLSSKPMRWIGEPQSLLINGRGQFDCSQAGYFNEGGLKECNFTKDDPCAPTTLRVEPNKVYRLRIASTTSLASLNLAVEGHQLEVVEADGNYVAPFTVDDIDIYSGETYSVLLRTHNPSPPRKYWISVGVRGRKPNTPQALTVLHYAGASESERLPFPPRETPRWDDFNRSKDFSKKIFAAKGYPPPPEKSNAQLFLLNTQNLMEGYTKWAINNLSLSVPATPYIGSIRYGLPLEYLKFPGPEIIENYDINHPPVNPNTTVSSGIYNLTMGMVVDVILQNSNVLKGEISEVHPWHLHGHDFWVLGYGEGKFQPGVDDKRYNLTNAPLRNTVALYPYGWTALRFVTDNPGVWFFHCHIEPHLHMGMGVVFAEGVDQIAKMNIPREALGCGSTREMFMNQGRH